MAQFLTDTAFAGNIESGGNIFPTSNGGGTLGLGNKQFSGLNLSSSSSVTWANGDASILEGEVGGYSLSFNVYNGVAALERVLLLEKSKVATFAGNVSVNNKIELYSDGTLNWGAAHDSGRITFDTGIAVVAGLSGKSLVLRSNGSGSSNTALTLDTSQNATFAGTILAGGGGAADGAIGAGHLSRQVPGRPSEAEVGSVDVRWSRCDLQQPVVRGGTGGWRPAIVEAVEVRGQVRASDRRVGDRYDHCARAQVQAHGGRSAAARVGRAH